MAMKVKVTVVNLKDFRSGKAYSKKRWKGEIIVENGSQIKVRGFHYPHDKLCEFGGGCFSPSGCGQVFEPDDYFYPFLLDLAEGRDRSAFIPLYKEPFAVERELRID
jgi:hypothetical protein